VRYDAGKATPEAMLRAVEKEGFQAKVTTGPTSVGPR
jgi:hypothetical protein